MVELRRWADRLDDLVADPATPWTLARVFETIDSTQDAARDVGGRPGLVVTAGRQIAGRGQRGRAWADTLEAGLAVTVALAAAPVPEMLLRVAVAAARAMQRFTTEPVGLKWPNDLMVRGRKVGGILIEQDAAVALVGIGVNVGARPWPQELVDRAVALAEVSDIVPDRLAVLDALLLELAAVADEPLSSLQAAFARLDVLCGATADLETARGTIRARVVAIDPLGSIIVEALDGTTLTLDPATTRMVPDSAIP